VYTQFSPQIFVLYSIGLFLGSIYSVPPLQLKRFPILAGGIIAVVRGFLLNFGIYYAVREALRIPFIWSPVVVFIASFMTVFASVIAITKVSKVLLHLWCNIGPTTWGSLLFATLTCYVQAYPLSKCTEP